MHHIHLAGAWAFLTEHAVLAYVLRTERLLGALFSFATVIWWCPSLGRVILRRATGQDDVRAIAVTLAVAIALFSGIGLAPNMLPLTALRLRVFAHACLIGFLLVAIYYHVSQEGRVRLSRVMMIHLGMLVLMLGFVAVAQ